VKIQPTDSPIQTRVLVTETRDNIFHSVVVQLGTMCESWLHIQKVVQDILFEMCLLQCFLMDSNEIAEEFQVKCVKPRYSYVAPLVAKLY
jgi:hypothetical protein